MRKRFYSLEVRIMKKVLTVLLAATGILAFSACGGNSVKKG